MRFGQLLATTLVALLAPGASAHGAETLRVQVPSFDGTRLDGVIHLPDEAAAGREVPVVLNSSPYNGTVTPQSVLGGSVPPWQPGRGPDRTRDWAGPVRRLLAEGYAVAMFSVRGTAASGGCLDFFGADEERDQAVLVRWLARQRWSNGRVGMIGLSYDSATAIEAAVRAPRALKAIVVTGVLTDFYVLNGTPQGAMSPGGQILQALFAPTLTASPPFGDAPEDVAAYMRVAHELACPDVLQAMTAAGRDLSGESRDERFYAERRRLDRLGRVRAAVLMGHGFHDYGHGFEEDLVWRALTRAPKSMYEGQWGHAWPQPYGRTPPTAWEDRTIGWFDFWLKRKGRRPPGLGRVEYEVGGGGRRASSDWPPAKARSQALHLTSAGAVPAVAGGDTSFTARPSTSRHFGAYGLRFGSPLCQSRSGAGVRYETAPLRAPAVIAGNPYARLRISADQPGGLIGVDVYELGPGFTCDGEEPRGHSRLLTFGAADLRFHAGNLAPRAFPVDSPQVVRVDLQSLADRVEPGNRLAIAIAHSDVRFTTRFAPRVTVHTGPGPEASHVVLPVVRGGFGAAGPRVAPPPRPFAP